MAERSGDFSQHVNDIYGRMFQNASIDPSDVNKIDESIRKIGMSKIVKVYDDPLCVLRRYEFVKHRLYGNLVHILYNEKILFDK